MIASAIKQEAILLIKFHLVSNFLGISIIGCLGFPCNIQFVNAISFFLTQTHEQALR
jgi:hypothetical protein